MSNFSINYALACHYLNTHRVLPCECLVKLTLFFVDSTVELPSVLDKSGGLVAIATKYPFSHQKLQSLGLEMRGGAKLATTRFQYLVAIVDTPPRRFGII